MSMEYDGGFLTEELDAHASVVAGLRDSATLHAGFYEAASLIVEALRSGGKLLVVGNGGSAADAQHLAAELTGRYLINRAALPSIALSTDTSALTAIGNDFGFEAVFSRQVEALARPRDVLFAISTSGNSKNIIAAMHEMKKCKNTAIIALSGRDGGAMKALADVNLIVPSSSTPRIQEMHIFLIHSLCNVIESNTSYINEGIEALRDSHE